MCLIKWKWRTNLFITVNILTENLLNLSVQVQGFICVGGCGSIVV